MDTAVEDMMANDLKRKYRDWKEWAITADQNDEGWQEDYPKWGFLMEAAIYEMTRQSPKREDIQYIDKCWAISKEGEHLADYARTHIDRCWDVLLLLTKSAYASTRWQVYDVLSCAGRKAENLLKKGLQDPDDYCKRRALLSLARLYPNDAKEIADQFCQHKDPYIRRAAFEMAIASKDTVFIDRIRQLFLQDPVWHVTGEGVLPTIEIRRKENSDGVL